MVTVPCSNADRDFYAAHAEAFGIEVQPTMTTARLKAAVEFVHRQSGLLMVYDEAHFLVPQNYSKGTAPRRLNWVRCEVIERGLGCAFFATPQSYKHTLADYVKHTGWNSDQWLGRLAPPVLLPEELGREDLLAVARIHFPEFPEAFLKLIAGYAMTSAGFLKSMDLVAKYARHVASKRESQRIEQADVELALREMMPGTELPVPAVPVVSERTTRRASAPVPQRRGSLSAVALQAGRAESICSPGQRQITPAVDPDQVLDPG
jgi:hypothetical protein